MMSPRARGVAIVSGDLRLAATLASHILVGAALNALSSYLTGAGNGTEPRLQFFIRQASVLASLAQHQLKG